MGNSGTPPAEDLETTVLERYAIESRLGDGASGVVYRAIDRDTGARVALKTLLMVTADQVSLLKNEFRVVQGLQHPNLVQILDLFGESDRWYLSMELVDGVDFLTYVTDPRGGFIEAKLRSSLRQLALAVAALHEARIVHRDLKPSNVLVTPDGRVVVLDFGLATSQDRRHARDQGIAGTVLYMAPEQALSEHVGPAADWYAVGVMMFRAMTGVCPFEGVAEDVLARKASERASSSDFEVPALPPDLAVLCDQLLRTFPDERPLDAEILSRLGAVEQRRRTDSIVPNLHVIGRDTEMAWLRDAFQLTCEGQASAVVLSGESGVGKSVLLHAFFDQLHVEYPDLLTLWSRCYEREFVPFKAFDGAVDGLVAVLERTDDATLGPWLSEHAGLLPRIFPELGLVPALAALAEITNVDDPFLARRLGFDALRQLLAGLASSRGLALVIEDLQWADADSLELLRALLEPSNAPPMFLVGTKRAAGDAEVGEDGGNMVLPGLVNTLRLEKLQPADAEELAVDLLRAQHLESLPRDEILSLVREADGHPMFLAELVLHANGQRGGTAGRRLEDVLRARICGLDRDARRLLEVVCVAGVRVDQRVAADAAAIDRSELARLVPLLHAERLVQTTRSPRTTVLQPYHERIRDSVVAGLPDEQVGSWNGKIALALELSGGTVEPEVLAQTWLRAGAHDRAKSYILRGAAKANAAFAFDRAASFFEQAISLSSSPLETKALRLELALALTNAKRWRDAAELRLELAADAEPVASLRLRTLAAEQLLCSGCFEKGAMTLLGVMETVRVFVPKSPFTALLALFVARALLMLRGWLPPAPLQEDEHRAATVDSIISASFGFGMTDNILGSYFSTRALLAALGTREPLRLARTLFSETLYIASRGDRARPRATRLIAHLETVVQGIDKSLGSAYVAGARGYLHHFALEWPEAKAAFLESARIFNDECVGQFWATNTTRTLGFRAMVSMGQARELKHMVASALGEAERTGDIYAITNLKTGPHAWLRLVEDETTEAERELAALPAMLPTSRFVVQRYFYLVARVQFLLYRGDVEAAHALVEADWPKLQRSLLLRMSALRVVAWDLRGRAALASAACQSGTVRRARLRFVQLAAARLGREPYACAMGYAASLLAGGHALDRRKLEAAREAERAVASFGRASMSLHVAASRWCQGASLGGDEGARLVAAAQLAFTSEGVRKPLEFVRSITPGCL